jgi:hypothetical protein
VKVIDFSKTTRVTPKCSRIVLNLRDFESVFDEINNTTKKISDIGLVFQRDAVEDTIKTIRKRLIAMSL